MRFLRDRRGANGFDGDRVFLIVVVMGLAVFVYVLLRQMGMVKSVYVVVAYVLMVLVTVFVLSVGLNVWKNREDNRQDRD